MPALLALPFVLAAFLLLPLGACQPTAAPSEPWLPDYRVRGVRKPWVFFRASIQLAVANRSQTNREALLLKMSAQSDMPRNRILAEHIQEVLHNRGPFNRFELQFAVAVIVSDATVIPSFRRSQNDFRPWIMAEDTRRRYGEFSDGMLHVPTSLKGCFSPQTPQFMKAKLRDRQLGLPCPEGGAVVVKHEIWGGGIVQPGKHIMVLYLPLLQLQAEEPHSVRSLRGVVPTKVIRESIDLTLRREIELPIDLTALAMNIKYHVTSKCPKPPSSVSFAVLVAAEEVRREVNSSPAAEDSSLSYMDAAFGDIYQFIGFIRVVLGQENVGVITLKIVVCPLYES